MTPVVEPPEQDRGTPQRLQTQLFLSFLENHFQTDTVVLSARGCEEDDADAVDVDGMVLADVFSMITIRIWISVDEGGGAHCYAGAG